MQEQAIKAKYEALKSELDERARRMPVPLRGVCDAKAQGVSPSLPRRLAKELCQQGHHVSHTKVGQLLKALHYSLQGTRKTREGTSHPDRDAQFAYINAQVQALQRCGQPVVSVDTKKKALVGDVANRGCEYQPHGMPELVRIYDFMDQAMGKAIPYDVYDMT